MSALDNGIIASALTSINYSFHVSEVQGTWGITLYTLGMAISTPIVGKLADKYGRKKLFLIEIAIFALGSLMVAMSSSFILFLAAGYFNQLAEVASSSSPQAIFYRLTQNRPREACWGS